MQKTGAKLIWASRTPILDDAAKNQMAASIVERNKAAGKLMTKYGVVTDDLFTAITPHLENLQNPIDVHFNAAGYEFLGQHAADAITKAWK
jgi:acyl-CoA thioesterase-1